ncbi:MAG: 3D domain-containing protein [Tumebacillaceae bacterium]
MHTKTFQSLAVLFLSLLLTACPFQASAQGDGTLTQHQNELQHLQSDLHTLDSSLQATRTKARDLATEVSDLMFQSRDLQQQIKQTKQQIAARNELFKKRVKVMYLDGDMSYLEVLFDAKDFPDLVDRMHMLTLIVQQDQALVDQLHREYATLEQEQKQLQAQQQEQAQKQEQLFALESTLQSQLQDKQSQINAKQNEIHLDEQTMQAQFATLPTTQPTALPSRGDLENGSNAAYAQMVATAYTAPSTARTYTGAKPAKGTAAVDPRVIPLGTKLYIEGYGYAVATDTGLDIKGNRIDLFFNSVDQCIQFGRRVVKVYRVS